MLFMYHVKHFFLINNLIFVCFQWSNNCCLCKCCLCWSAKSALPKWSDSDTLPWLNVACNDTDINHLKVARKHQTDAGKDCYVSKRLFNKDPHDLITTAVHCFMQNILHCNQLLGRWSPGHRFSTDLSNFIRL